MKAYKLNKAYFEYKKNVYYYWFELVRICN